MWSNTMLMCHKHKLIWQFNYDQSETAFDRQICKIIAVFSLTISIFW